MKIEQAKLLAEKAIAELADQLERGQSADLKQYLAAMAKFPRYSLHNVLLILSQRPNASRVAGYHAWHHLGRQVNRGAKGILIIAPVIRKKDPSIREDDDGSVRLAGFRGIHVFAEEDTSGQPLPALSSCQGNPSSYLERMKEFARSRKLDLVYSETIRPAFGQCSQEKIVLLPGLEPAVEFAVLAHELGHHLLHFSDRRAETTKRVRETEAEAIAFVVCQAAGLDSLRSASEYISLYSGDKDLLTESLVRIQQASAEIITAILPPG